MKHTNTILTALVCTALSVSGCITDIEYNGPDSKSMLVVNSITKEGSVPVLHMSRSRSFLEYYYSNDDIKSDVNVSIDINGNELNASYGQTAGGYTDGRKISQGDIITVSASHHEYGSITATDTVPYMQDYLLSSYTKKHVHAKTMSEAFDEYYTDFDDSKVDSSWVIEIDIKDRKNADDFYMLKIWAEAIYTHQFEYDSIPDTVSMGLHFKVPATTKMLLGQSDAATALLEETEEDSQFEYYTIDYMFTDQHIKEGGKLTFDILLEKPDTTNRIYFANGTYFYGFYPDNDSIFDLSHIVSSKYGNEIRYKLSIELYSLSRSYYYYRKSAQDYSEADMSFMSEPVTIIHNVKGGLGILGTYAIKQDSIEYTRCF